MAASDEMGLTPEAAEGYEAYFLPAIFAQWPPVLQKLAKLESGASVLDVGCGTGVLTRELVEVVGPSGKVTGLDLSESMLGVARTKAPHASFRQGNATDIPFENACFDAVFAPFMLMFVPEPAKAVSEMWRVLRPGGSLVISVWEEISKNPVYAALVDIASHRISQAAGDSIAWPYELGKAGKLEAILESAEIGSAVVDTYNGRGRFPSLEDLVHTEIKSWLLSESVNDENIRALIADARTALSAYCKQDGSIDFPFNAIVASATKHA